MKINSNADTVEIAPRKISNIENTVQEISHLYRYYGQLSYEEKCTQLEHAQQCGTLALEYNLDEEMALAAFLHDIGHFIAQRDNHSDFTRYGYSKHDALGAKYLAAQGFSKRMVNLVAEHVNVKRYFAATRPNYLAQLSHASTVTLSQQGGPMSSEEAEIYRRHPYIADIISLRRLDDSGKQPEMACKELDFWMLLITRHLST